MPQRVGHVETFLDDRRGPAYTSAPPRWTVGSSLWFPRSVTLPVSTP